MSKSSAERVRRDHDSIAHPDDAVALRQTLAQTRQLLRQEKEGRRRAESTTRAVDDFLATLAHELRQPLAAAIAALEIQKHSPRADRQDRARRVIDQQIRYIARLVGDLSEVSRISRGDIELRRECLDLCAMVREALLMTEALFEERRHTVTALFGTGAAWVDGDEVRLKQVMSNLLRNAALYTPAGGHVAIVIDSGADYVRCRIADNGVGIAADSLERIFDLFHRGSYRCEHQGSGIGLAVVRRLVELHGGTVTAESEGPGRGSEFTVVFPRARSA